MKREPRLQFSDADLAEPKLEKKPIKRGEKKSGGQGRIRRKAEKIPKENRESKKERGFDPATGKVKKRSSVLRKWIRKSRPQS